MLTTVVPAGEPTGTETLITHARCGGSGPVLLPAASGGHAVIGARHADGLVAVVGPAQCHAAFDQARDRRQRDRLTAPFELWTPVARPDGREQWRDGLAAAEAVGATGISLPSYPGLLDLLRNADEEDDRSDLTLAQG